MDDSLNPEREMERLSGMHDQIQRLREQLQQLKQKESDANARSREGAVSLNDASGRNRQHPKK